MVNFACAKTADDAYAMPAITKFLTTERGRVSPRLYSCPQVDGVKDFALELFVSARWNIAQSFANICAYHTRSAPQAVCHTPSSAAQGWVLLFQPRESCLEMLRMEVRPQRLYNKNVGVN